jgi:hypothetical protein
MQSTKKDRIKIKLTLPGTKSTRSDASSLGKYLPSNSNSHLGCDFYLNEEIERPDYWIVQEGHPIKEECLIHPRNIFYIIAESMVIADYVTPTSEQFLKQFEKVLAPHFIFTDNAEYNLPFQCWTVDAGYHKGFFDESELNYKFLSSTNPPKTKTLSLFCSSRGKLDSDYENHRVRYRFLMKLKEHFKDKLDLFGNGINPCNPKWMGLHDYKYTITLENQSRYDIITEKLYDSFLAECYPIYYGAPNTNKYFDPESFSPINIADFKGSIHEIERVIESNLWEKNYSNILNSKHRTLNDYNWLMRIAKICTAHHSQTGPQLAQDRKKITIKPHSFFQGEEKKRTKITKLKRKLTKIFGFKTA